MTGVFGGGVIFVVAALLWAAVLVPSWVRRREFKAAERNAVRLQRTLRVLAETAEVPTEVRVEATAREALAHEKLLRTAQRQQEAERQARLAEARAAQLRAEMRAQQMRRKQAAIARSAKLRRPIIRRLRAISALVATLALAAVLVGTGFVFAGQGWAMLGIGGSAFVAALGALVLMAPGRVKHVEIPAEQAVEPVDAPVVVAENETSGGADRSEAAAAHAAAQAAAAARIERARAMARARARARARAHAHAQRPADRENQPQSMLLEQVREQVLGEAQGAEVGRAQGPVAGRAQGPEPGRAPGARGTASRSQDLATAERLRAMGVIEDVSEGGLDLSSALRQRRRAG